MPSPTALTLYAFGISAVLLGLATLYDSQANADFMALPAGSLPSVRASALATTAIGTYYMLLAYQNNRLFAVASVPVRCLTTYGFISEGGNWRLVGAWEGAGAAATACALAWEHVAGQRKQKIKRDTGHLHMS
jgi:hypothetical protein